MNLKYILKEKDYEELSDLFEELTKSSNPKIEERVLSCINRLTKDYNKEVGAYLYHIYYNIGCVRDE